MTHVPVCHNCVVLQHRIHWNRKKHDALQRFCNICPYPFMKLKQSLSNDGVIFFFKQLQANSNVLTINELT